ncbi:hypothetical protein D7X30_07680 [Corallococcus sp. AB011P]|nr:hypothetical protein D7X30_07680 [Corallococcus sp. AB011P]
MVALGAIEDLKYLKLLAGENLQAKSIFGSVGWGSGVEWKDTCHGPFFRTTVRLKTRPSVGFHSTSMCSPAAESKLSRVRLGGASLGRMMRES